MISAHRREAKREARRTAIVEVARRHFLRQGYDQTSMSSIVAEMGGSKATLWQHFASKEDLFTAVIDEATTSFQRDMTVILDPVRDAVEALTNFAFRFISRLTTTDAIALQRLIAGEVARFPELGRIFYERAPLASHALLSAYLARLLPEQDPSEAAKTLLGLCTGQYHQKILLGIARADTVLAAREASLAIRQFRRCYPELT